MGKKKKINKEVLKDCTLLVLCKSELFFQKHGGDTITTWYPVGEEAASICSLYFDIPLSYDGGPNVDNEEVITNILKKKWELRVAKDERIEKWEKQKN